MADDNGMKSSFCLLFLFLFVTVYMSTPSSSCGYGGCGIPAYPVLTSGGKKHVDRLLKYLADYDPKKHRRMESGGRRSRRVFHNRRRRRR